MELIIAMAAVIALEMAIAAFGADSRPQRREHSRQI
jgi:hypothetical protein